MTWFLLAVFAVAVLSGATATVVGFGIGSLLTPLLALEAGMATAVALVGLPHAAATALRFWRLRRVVDWRVVRQFGLLSATGGLMGALLYARLGSRALTLILAALLLLTSVAGLAGGMGRRRPGPWAAGLLGLLGLLSGFFGGVAGNQGGLRSAALLAFPLTPAAFVATATATALAVDAVRVPVYVWRAGSALADYWLPGAIATVGVLVGTLVGERTLRDIPADRFRRVVSLAIGLIGIWLLVGAV